MNVSLRRTAIDVVDCLSLLLTTNRHRNRVLDNVKNGLRREMLISKYPFAERLANNEKTKN